MLTFAAWLAMVLIYVIIILATGEMMNIAQSRCLVDDLCIVYGLLAQRMCKERCEYEVSNQLLGEVILITCLVACAAVFVLNYVYLLYSRIKKFYDHFPNYDEMNMRIVPDKSDLASEEFEDDVNEQEEKEKDQEEEDQQELKEGDALLTEEKNIPESLNAPMLSIDPCALDDHKDPPSISSFQEDEEGICSFPGCMEQALDLQCPLCHVLGSVAPLDSYYCSQVHFNRDWKSHRDKYHK
jgi:hypothetical protein